MMQEHILDTLNGNLPPNVATPPGLMQRVSETGPWSVPPSGGLVHDNGPLEPPPGMTTVNGHIEYGVPTPSGPPHSGLITSTSPTDTTSTASAASAAAAKKSSSRRNAWGNHSYADLITQAIQSTPEKRLTLSQVYEWMVANIPYFKDKGDSNSSAGWKNSIRHNLSLHSRFIRVQNEGTGKSSWWMLNPDAKPGGKTSRRRTASVEGSGGTNGNGGRGPDFKRRGRNKKNASNGNGIGGPGNAGGGNGLLRNGHHLNSHPGGGGPDSTPSPNGPVHPHIGGNGNMIELYPESPSLHHPSHQYPFPPGPPGRLSPSSLIHPGDHPPFGYPGPQQEWIGSNGGDYQCGNMAPYFAGNAPRGYCESIGNTAGATGPGSEVDYSGQRPLSPQHILQQQQQQQQQQRNGFPFPNRGSFPSPSTPSNNGGAPGGGSENFHSFHADKLPHSLAEANTFPSIQQVMSPSDGPPNVSPSGAGNANHNREAATNNRSFSSPDAHRPSSTNNDPLISPHHLGSHPQSFFPPQQQPQPPPLAPMRPTSPGSPGSVKTPKNNNGSILERALASTIKTEPVSTATSGTATSVVLTNCIDTSSTVAGHIGQMQDQHWPQQTPQQQSQYGEDLGQFMKHEINDLNLEYDLNYSNAMSAGGQPGGPGSGALHQGVSVLPQGHHHLASNRGGHVHHQLVHHQEDHLHSPSQYSMSAAATQQPPWVR